MDTSTLISVAITANSVKSTLSSIGSNPFQIDDADGDDTNNSKMTVTGETSDNLVDGGRLSFYSTSAIAVGAIVSGIVSLALFNVTMVEIISSVLLSFIIGPAVAIQRYKLLQLGGFRGQHNHLRSSINRFTVENKQLNASITAMETEIKSLDTINVELEKIATKNGKSMEYIQELLHTNATLQEKMITNLQNNILQEIITVSLNSDTDKDFVIDISEIDILLLRLQNIKGVTVNVEKMKSYLTKKQQQPNSSGCKLTYADFIDIARDLQSATIDPLTPPTETVRTESQQFFTFHPKDYL